MSATNTGGPLAKAAQLDYADSGAKMTTYYRWVFGAELKGLRITQRFTIGGGSAEGKYLAATAADAEAWGAAMRRWEEDTGCLATIVLPDESAVELVSDHLDGIGPCWFAKIKDLQHPDVVITLEERG